MGIHSDIDPLEDADIENLIAADELLAEALGKFAGSEFAKANKKNRDVAGDWVPYKVMVDGQTVYEGRGEFFPEHQVAAYIPRAKTRGERQREAYGRLGKIVGKIVVEWVFAWARKRLLRRAIEALLSARKTYYDLQDVNKLADLILSSPELADLGTYLVERWITGRTRWFRGIEDARAIYRIISVYNRVRGASGGSDEGDPEQADLLRWIAAELIAESPVVSGDYRGGNELYVDGVRVASAEEIDDGATIPEGKVYAFVATVPYARRLEVGTAKTGRRKGQPFVRQVPPHIYERVAAAAQGHAGTDATVRFNYTDVDEGRTAPRSGSRYQLLFPTIIVTFR